MFVAHLNSLILDKEDDRVPPSCRKTSPTRIRRGAPDAGAVPGPAHVRKCFLWRGLEERGAEDAPNMIRASQVPTHRSRLNAYEPAPVPRQKSPPENPLFF